MHPRVKRRSMRLLLLPLGVLLLAGCLEAQRSPPAASESEWMLGGSWTEGYTQADLDAWCAIAERYGNECIVMESFPPQFALRFDRLAECEAARAEVVALERIVARECRPASAARADAAA